MPGSGWGGTDTDKGREGIKDDFRFLGVDRSGPGERQCDNWEHTEFEVGQPAANLQ